MSEGVGSLEEFLEGQAKFTAELCEKAKTAQIQVPEGSYICDKCKSGIMVKRKGKYSEFWGCSNYPRCKNTYNDKDGMPDYEGKKNSPPKRRNFPDNRVTSMSEFVRNNFISSEDFIG